MTPPDPRPALACVGAAALLGLLTGGTAAATTPASLPGPQRGHGRPDAVAQNRACEACHVEIAAEWRASLHHRASTEPSYRRSLRREPSAFCRSCHAPEGDPDAPARATDHLGVGCVTCHAPAGAILAAPSDMSSTPAPHPVLPEPRFAGVGACAGCHEFAFPGQTALMQSTLTEHAVSSSSDIACAGCHMPRTGGERPHRSHAFVASRDPDVLRQALRVASERAGPSSVRLTLRPGAVGHAFPTGDLFRRLVVRAEVDAGPRRGRASAQRVLARHFGSDTRTLLADDRVGAPALAGADLVVDLELGPSAVDRPIRWTIRYERVAFPRDEHARAELDGWALVAEGVLLPPAQ